jgi:phosphoenolpyruvate carboxykinase (diphosphate)
MFMPALDPVAALGLPFSDFADRTRQVNLLLLANGLPAPEEFSGESLTDVSRGFLESHAEQQRLLTDYRCPIDRRIEAFLASHFADLKLATPLRLPARTLVLSRHGIARELSLPATGNEFTNDYLTSYRAKNGVLHNPRSDRRTTDGTFHVTEGGLPIPGDKRAVPKAVFAALFVAAIVPPMDMQTLPFMANQPTPARTFVSLLLRPLVCPEVPGVCLEKSMEVRFFAPGSLVSNLDFVESIFGNAGDPFLPKNDAGLDPEHWTGHTGCVILAPHLTELTKKTLGLPKWEEATERQRADSMCWKSENEKYNNGVPFKLTCRTKEGVIVTLIADNYYGYCKKEVKTQISYAANLYGNVEEEHAGGAIAFASFNLGDEFVPDSRSKRGDRTWTEVARDYADLMDVQAGGYGIDKEFPNLIYIPETARASLKRLEVWWTKEGGKEVAIPLAPENVYMFPTGYKIHIEKHPGAPSWRIIGTAGDGTFCHKPCTVSGGGKSEISKSLRDYMLYGPIFVADLEKDLAKVTEIFEKDYSKRWKSKSTEPRDFKKRPSRAILSAERSLGSVIKLLTPTPDYTDEFNAWLESIPSHIYAIVFIIKRFHKQEWGNDWRMHFHVDIVNGAPGNELKIDQRKLVGTYLRVGLLKNGDWRTFKLRQDFAAAQKIQTEDDITASVVVPAAQASSLIKTYAASSGLALSYKFAQNCEYRLFQRPDDAVHRGLDKQTEHDMAQHDNFISNFEPLRPDAVERIVKHVVEFEKFTEPMQACLREALEEQKAYAVSSAHPRMVDGKPSKNPRYLQTRPDLLDPFSTFLAHRSMRFARATPSHHAVLTPVNAVLIGRRNNPEEKAAGIRGLAIYNPIHYQELPELFMDFICSLTGKSPSTTGTGSEGALTKSPFNALRPIADLNNALVSYILTGLAGFSTSAGYVGPRVRIDHDISLLVPEIWCRLAPNERDPRQLIAQGYLERLNDFEHAGEKIHASRLGYRITPKFVSAYFGRVFDNPAKVFDEQILRPETQDFAAYVDGIKNICEAQQRVAKQYLADGSVEDACPPLRALIHIMAAGAFEGKDAHSEEVRSLFTREYVLGSDWYAARLKAKQRVDVALWKRHLAYMGEFMNKAAYRPEVIKLGLSGRLHYAQAESLRTASENYLGLLSGTLGADPSLAPE